MKNRKGFTMIELLATVTILGILMTVTIGYAMRLINKSKNDSMEQQTKLVTTAAESYFQAHREQLPRLVGQTTKIPISTLLETNYLKKEVKNAKGESCMEKSFITAHKDSRTKYTYKAYLYCGNDTVPSPTSSPGPNITIDFCREETGTCLYKDGDQQVKNSVADAIISIEISGNKIGGEEINLEGYTWSILAKYDGEEELKEVYNSGELSAKGHYSIKIPKETSKQKYILKNYLDLTNTTDITVKVVATNEKGGITEKQKSILYQDTIPPICGTVEGESTTWINKNTPLTEAVRIISVECKDGNGSGCVRNKFTQIWPTTTEPTVENSSIKIEDNIGLSTECPIAVNIDREAPVIKLEKATTNGNTNILDLKGTSNTTAGTTNDSVTLSEDKYKNLNNNWMNKANYQNGVTYTFTISDNYQLANWKFETDNTEESGTEQITGTSKQIQVSFNKDGRRQGKLTVIDKAGNSATYTVKANLDREVPPVPNIYLRKWKDNNDSTPTNRNGLEEYIEGTWSNKNIYTAAEKNAETVTSPSHFELATSGLATNFSEGNPLKNIMTWNVKEEGNNIAIKYRVCDDAGNCSEYNSKAIKLDKTAPVLSINLTSNGQKLSSNEMSSYPITRTITISDPILANGSLSSGIEKDLSTNSEVMYSLESNNYNKTKPKSEWTKETNLGEYTYNEPTVSDKYYRIYDNAGNHSEDVHLIVRYKKGNCFQYKVPSRGQYINVRYEPTWGKTKYKDTYKWCGQGDDGTNRRTCSSQAYYYVPEDKTPEEKWQIQVICDDVDTNVFAPSGATIKNKPSKTGGIVCYSSADSLGNQQWKNKNNHSEGCIYPEFVKVKILVKDKNSETNPYLRKTSNNNERVRNIPNDFVGGEASNWLRKSEIVDGNTYYYFFMSSSLIGGIECQTETTKTCACNGESGCNNPNTELCDVTKSECKK